MSQKHSKSKLKRNKSSVGDEQPVKSSPESSPLAPTAQTGRSVWWSRECLPLEENLWALTLKSALPNLGDLHWDPVPDLPHPSTANARPIKPDEQLWWSELSKDVAPLLQSSLLVSSPPSKSSLKHTKRGPELPATPTPFHHRPSRDKEAAPPLQALPQSPRPSFNSSSPGPSSAGGHKRKTGGQPDEETGPVSRQPLTKLVTSQGSLQGKDEVHTHVAEGVEGERLQSCPMCLVVFPDGFTQMDCDSHLAQCLSEVNVDVTW
ncbi:uncharacterized protein AB9W97_018229 isoform 1-T1 [Spinachia spinachia]